MHANDPINVQELASRSSIPCAYRLAYVINWYREPLLKRIENEFGLSRPEWTVLLCLSLRDGMISRDIAEITGQPRNSISRGVEMLVGKGLVTRSSDRKDRRKSILAATARGRAAFDKMIVEFEARESQMLNVLSASEKDTLDRILSKLTAGVALWRED